MIKKGYYLFAISMYLWTESQVEKGARGPLTLRAQWVIRQFISTSPNWGQIGTMNYKSDAAGVLPAKPVRFHVNPHNISPGWLLMTCDKTFVN